LSAEKRDAKHASAEDNVEKRRVTVSVVRMDCATCALAIEKQIKRLNGIKAVNAAIMLNKVFIDYDPSLVDSTAIRKAIDKTGYKIYITVEENQ